MDNLDLKFTRTDFKFDKIGLLFPWEIENFSQAT